MSETDSIFKLNLPPPPPLIFVVVVVTFIFCLKQCACIYCKTFDFKYAKNAFKMCPFFISRQSFVSRLKKKNKEKKKMDRGGAAGH